MSLHDGNFDPGDYAYEVINNRFATILDEIKRKIQTKSDLLEDEKETEYVLNKLVHAYLELREMAKNL